MSSSTRSSSCSPIDSFAARFKLRGELHEVVVRVVVVRARGHGVVVPAIHCDGVRRGARARDDPAAPIAARGGELRDEGAVDAAEEGRAPVLAGNILVTGENFATKAPLTPPRKVELLFSPVTRMLLAVSIASASTETPSVPIAIAKEVEPVGENFARNMVSSPGGCRVMLLPPMTNLPTPSIIPAVTMLFFESRATWTL